MTGCRAVADSPPRERGGWPHIGARILALAGLAALLAGCAGDPQPRRQDEPNPPSRGVIDMPSADQRVGPRIVVAGWVIDESGVDRVRIYADDHLLASVPLTVARPDVEKVFPDVARPGATHGWEAVIDVGHHLGYVTIHAEALDTRGALTRFAHVTVRVEP